MLPDWDIACGVCFVVQFLSSRNAHSYFRSTLVSRAGSTPCSLVGIKIPKYLAEKHS